jgi:hypothetical protein
LSELHAQDPWVAVGDTISVGGLAFEKRLSSHAFARRVAQAKSAQFGAVDSGDGQDPIGDGGAVPRWNSVFKVLGDATAIEAVRAMAALEALAEPADELDLLIDSLEMIVEPRVDDQEAEISGAPASPFDPPDSAAAAAAGEVSS